MQRADRRKFHYIYKITRDDGKYYIGMHSTDNLDDGYFGSGKLITRSIKKHGLERHSKEILEFVNSRNELKMREQELVTEEIIGDKFCMNLKLGGTGGWIFHSEQQLRAASAGGKVGGQISVWSMLTPERKAKSVQTRRDKNLFTTEAARIAATLPEAIEKRKTTYAERLHMQGEKNSQYGTCWVTDGVKPVKIKKELLDEYLAKGFKRGRNTGL